MLLSSRGGSAGLGQNAWVTFEKSMGGSVLEGAEEARGPNFSDRRRRTPDGPPSAAENGCDKGCGAEAARLAPNKTLRSPTLGGYQRARSRCASALARTSARPQPPRGRAILTVFAPWPAARTAEAHPRCGLFWPAARYVTEGMGFSDCCAIFFCGATPEKVVQFGPVQQSPALRWGARFGASGTISSVA